MPAIDPHPLAALATSPFQGEVTELVGRADSISAEAALVEE
jgi:hypothetical protein